MRTVSYRLLINLQSMVLTTSAAGHASSDVEAPRGRDPLSFVSAPFRRKQATRDLTLKIISHPAAPRGDVVCNVAFSLPSTRLTHGFKKGAKDAPQDVDPVYHRF